MDIENLNEEHYTRSVTELADLVSVTTSQEVFSSTGIKLVNKGIRLNSSFFERLGRHKILPPLEQCLVVENGVNNKEIVSIAQHLLETDPSMARMVNLLPIPAEIFAVLQSITLTDPVVFLLTLARERRSVLLRHSVKVALISVYLGMRLCLTRAKLVELASAGIFHDLGELRIDADLYKQDAHPTPEEREKMYSHSAISQHMLLNSSGYSLEILMAVLKHHESVDGSGYPFGLRGKEMDGAAKILSIAEVAGTKLDKEALDGVPGLEVAFKLNLSKFDPVLLGFLSVLYEHHDEDSEGVQPQISVSLPQIHSQINHISLALVFWKRLLGDTQIRARSPSAYIHQRLNSLWQSTREAGINTSDQSSITTGIGGDEKCMAELSEINQETLRQILEIVFEVQRRWPTYREDHTDVGRVVSGWMEHMQGLLLEKRERSI